MESSGIQIPSPQFPTALQEIEERLAQIDPVEYGFSRNFSNGAVSYLSPYITRGVLSTKRVLESVLNRGFDPIRIEKFIQELAWRDYWQTVWLALGDRIEVDIRHPQPHAKNKGIPEAISRAITGIDAIDRGISILYETGYMHNHIRMYLAALTCNVGRYYWKEPARWLYYHLLDGDWASNVLSWQWVAGSNSNKMYFADQNNINRYTGSRESGTYLDRSYEELAEMDVPTELKTGIAFDSRTALPETPDPVLNDELPLLLYHPYNLDPTWRNVEKANRILILDPAHFDRYPVSDQVVNFYLGLSHNIPNIQVYCGSVENILSKYNGVDIHYREHPFYNSIAGNAEPREWMSSIRDYYPSFFQFWKKVRKDLGIFNSQVHSVQNGTK